MKLSRYQRAVVSLNFGDASIHEGAHRQIVLGEGALHGVAAHAGLGGDLEVNPLVGVPAVNLPLASRSLLAKLYGRRRRCCCCCHI